MLPRSAARDDRRRRLFRDDLPVSNVAATPSRSSSGEAAAPRRSQAESSVDGAIPSLRLVDLIPCRPLALAGLFAAGVAIIAGLELLYFWMQSLASLTTDGSIAAFDLDREGSLGAWWSTTQLTLAAAAAWIVYLMRRARADDYQARYRIWLWASLCWLVMGIDESASLHEGFKELAVQVTGMRVVGDGSIWWMAGYLLILALLGLRLLLDLRGSWLALTCLGLSAASFAVAALGQLEWLPGLSIAGLTMVEEGAEMLGGLFLTGAMVTHARFLILGGGTAAPVRRRRTRRKPEAESVEAEAETPVVARRTAPEPQAAAPIRRTDPPAVAVGGPHRMSKSERKALRRQSQQDRDDWN